MIKENNSRLPVLIDKKKLAYLKQVVAIYNSQLESKKYNEEIGLRRLSVSSLYGLALDLFIVELDSRLPFSLGREEVHKEIFDFISKKI